MSTSATYTTRNGRGAGAYKRKRLQLMHRTKKNNDVCAWCGKPFDWTADPQSGGGFTADHIQPLNRGGELLGDLQPLHRACNARKGDHAAPTIRGAT